MSLNYLKCTQTLSEGLGVFISSLGYLPRSNDSRELQKTGKRSCTSEKIQFHLPWWEGRSIPQDRNSWERFVDWNRSSRSMSTQRKALCGEEEGFLLETTKKLALKGGKVSFPKQLLPCTSEEIKLHLPASFLGKQEKGWA